MDHRFELKDVTFVWDAEKAASNLQKHHISFQRAAEASFDPFLIVVDATRGREVRQAVLGLDSELKLLYVVNIRD